MSTYTPEKDLEIFSTYDVRINTERPGLSIRIKDRNIENIWLKAGWVENKDRDFADCIKALELWLG